MSNDINAIVRKLREATLTALTAPAFGSSPDAALERLKLHRQYHDLIQPEKVLPILDALEAAQKRNAELEDKLAREQDYYLGIDIERMELHKNVKELESRPVPVVPDEWRNSLKELVTAMRHYEMDADEDAPHKHKAMMKRAKALLSTSPAQPLREKVRAEHAVWSDETFGDVGPVGPLKHLSKEALEAAADPSDLLEWADMQFLLWDAQRRMGISDSLITKAMIEKLAINKTRQWSEVEDGEACMHVKIDQQPVIPEGYKLVSIEPTPDMIAAALNSNDINFHEVDDGWDVRVNYDVIYASMIEAAPAPEGE